MKFILNKNDLKMPPAMFLRSAGYSFLLDRHEGHDSFIRRITGAFYPRFHIYFEEDNDNLIINLHLDQKKPSYPGAHKHNAEYDGDTVQQEINRLKSLI